MIYRLLDNLSYRDGRFLEKGTLQRLDDLSPGKIAILLERGAIAIPASPPLAALPGWETRAKRLEGRCEIVTIIQLLDANPQSVATALRTRAETVRAWQAEAEQFLQSSK